jgi:hypothetical protein
MYGRGSAGSTGRFRLNLAEQVRLGRQPHGVVFIIMIMRAPSIRMQVRQSEGLNFAVASDEVAGFFAGRALPSATAGHSAFVDQTRLDRHVRCEPRTLAPVQALTTTYFISHDGESAKWCSARRSTGGSVWISDPPDDAKVTLGPGRRAYGRTSYVTASIVAGAYDLAWGLLGTDIIVLALMPPVVHDSIVTSTRNLRDIKPA